jgi:hypothetical protein
MTFNIYYIDSTGCTGFSDVPRNEVLDVVGRILDEGLEITGVINSKDDE